MKSILTKIVLILTGLVSLTSPVFAGTKVSDIPIQNIEAALELSKYTDDIVDITKVAKYGDNAIKHGDDIFIKNAVGSIKLHHIVEQHSDNVTKFGNKPIHKTLNIIEIPHKQARDLYRQIKGYCNRIDDTIE